MLIGSHERSLFWLRNYLGKPALLLPSDVTLDTLLNALEETTDPRLIASFARHIAVQEDIICLEPLLGKYSDDLPMYAKQSLWHAIAASVQTDEEESPLELINRVLAQQDLPFQLLIEVYQACPNSYLFERNYKETDRRKRRAILRVIDERFDQEE